MLCDRGSVSHLHQIVDLNAAPNAGFTDAGAVHAGVRLHFNVAFQHRRAGLGDLFPAISVTGKTEAVASDNGAILQNDVVAQPAVFAYDSVRMREEMVASACAAITHNVRHEHSIVSDLDILVNHHVGRNVCLLANSGSGCDYGCGM